MSDHDLDAVLDPFVAAAAAALPDVETAADAVAELKRYLADWQAQQMHAAFLGARVAPIWRRPLVDQFAYRSAVRRRTAPAWAAWASMSDEIRALAEVVRVQ